MALLNLCLSDVQNSRTLLPQWKGGKTHGIGQVCQSHANLLLRGSLREKKKEELKGINSSITQQLWFLSCKKGQFCSCLSLLGLYPALLSLQGERECSLPEGGQSGIVKSGFCWCPAISMLSSAGESQQHKVKHAFALLHLCKTYRYHSSCEWTLNKPNG